MVSGFSFESPGIDKDTHHLDKAYADHYTASDDDMSSVATETNAHFPHIQVQAAQVVRPVRKASLEHSNFPLASSPPQDAEAKRRPSTSSDKTIKFGITGSTPLPHLPLRRAASKELRNGQSRPSRPVPEPIQTHGTLLGPGLSKVKSAESKSSMSSSSEQFPDELRLNRSRTSPLPPPSPLDGLGIHNVASPTSPLPPKPALRMSGQLPNARFLRGAHPEFGSIRSVSDRSQQSSQTSSPSLGPFSPVVSPAPSTTAPAAVRNFSFGRPGVRPVLSDVANTVNSSTASLGSVETRSVSASSGDTETLTTVSSAPASDFSSLRTKDRANTLAPPKRTNATPAELNMAPPPIPETSWPFGKEPRSASTRASSSTTGQSMTERSSIATSRTSTSDYTGQNTRLSDSIAEEEDDFSVEDYIALYAEGFGEEPPPEEAVPPMPTKTKPPSPLGPGRDRNAPPVPRFTTTTALSSPPPPSMPSPAEPPLPSVPKPFAEKDAGVSGRVTSVEIFSGQVEIPTSPTMVAEPARDPNADRYGFKKDNQYVSLEQYHQWNTAYEQYLDRRRHKWNDLMRQHALNVGQPAEFPPRSDKVKRFIRKGIPPEWRGAAWFWYAGGPQRLAANKGLYSRLLERIEEKNQLGEGDREHIERDLHRTFPDNDKFKRGMAAGSPGPESDNGQAWPERPMIGALRRVLRAFAVHQPKIGYCQSLNFLAGQMLLFLHGDEEKAFHLLCILTSEHLPGTHGVALEGANVDIGVLMSTLRDSMPQVWAKLDDRGNDSQSSSPTIPSTRSRMRGLSMARDDLRRAGRGGLPTVSLATTAWFMSCFVGTLPVEPCCRVWDVLFYEGSKTLFRVALGIFRLGEQEILNITDPMEVLQVVQTLPRKLLDANMLMEASLGKGLEGRGLLSQDTVEKRRSEKRETIQRERQTMAPKMPSAPAVPQIPQDQQENEGLKRSLSRGASIKRLTRLKSLKATKKPPPTPT